MIDQSVALKVNSGSQGQAGQSTAFDPAKAVMTAQRLEGALQPQEDDSSLDRAARVARAFSPDSKFAFRRPVTDDDTND
jgi:hypothetical protein